MLDTETHMTALPRVAVWYRLTASMSASAVASDAALLSPDERARADRFVFAEGRRDFVAAHALLRRALSRRTADDPAAWRFVAGTGGKPALASSQRGDPPIDFNLSHTRGLVACAVSAACAVGIDAEASDRAAGVEALAARYFHRSEAAHLYAQPADSRPLRFVELWTLKEACLKAIGAGLAASLHECVFSFHDDTTVRFDGQGRWASSPPWRFALYGIAGDRYRLAVAWRDRSIARPEIAADGEADAAAIRLLRASVGAG